MIIGSHNSWSYLKPKKWWMKLIKFTARCQRHPIDFQYFIDDVRCFDLHIRFDENNKVIVVHGPIEYVITQNELVGWLDWFDKLGDVYIRVLLDLRTSKAMADYDRQAELFKKFCYAIEKTYNNIVFWCGRMVKGWQIVYDFETNKDPRVSCCERYGSVTNPKMLWGWWPLPYALLHNRRNLHKGCEENIMLIDYTNINPERFKI